MKTDNFNKRLLSRITVLGPLILGTYLIVIRPFGVSFEFLPGDLGDARLNNYILEHFFRWVHGWTASYWNAPFFYPSPFTIAFSENLLGSAPLYVVLRFLGLDMLLAFQGWFLAGYIINYISAAWVLSKLRFGPLAVAAGAFFFTFGLPVLAQENHAQLLYRFAIPPAFFFLWSFYKTPKLRGLIHLFFWIVCQCYLGIYTGLFLLLAICVMCLGLLALSWRGLPLKHLVDEGWKGLSRVWLGSSRNDRIRFLASALTLLAGFTLLIWPYYHVSRLYRFGRDWIELSRMLPRPESYLLADNSRIWSFMGNLFSNILMRHEHQLFIGLSILLLIGAGIIFRFTPKNSELAWLNLSSVLVLTVFTLNVGGFSLYRFWTIIPGVSSLRAVTRIELIWMWPLAVFAAWAIDGLLERFQRGVRWAGVFAVATSLLMLCESVFYDHAVFHKVDSEARLDRLRRLIPVHATDSPILFVARNDAESSWALELDAMLVTQELGWSTFNGYSGNTPPEYEPAKNCRKLPRRIQAYMQTVENNDEAVYFELIKRVVLVGFEDCSPAWWYRMP